MEPIRKGVAYLYQNSKLTKEMTKTGTMMNAREWKEVRVPLKRSKIHRSQAAWESCEVGRNKYE